MDFCKTPTFAEFIEYADALVTPPDLIDSFVPAGAFTLIAGKQKISKKSQIAWMMASAMCLGRQVGPFKPTGKYRGVVLNFEGPPKPTSTRLKMVARTYGFDPNEVMGLHFRHGVPFNITSRKDLNELLEWAIIARLDFIIIDTFAQTFHGDENASGEVMNAVRSIKALTAVGLAVVVLHHMNKSSMFKEAGEIDPDVGMRGSTALPGAADSIIAITTARIDGKNKMFMQVIGKFRGDFYYEVRWEEKQDEYLRMIYEGPFQGRPIIKDSDIPKRRY
jgi:RecA-family ATPase